MNYYQRENICSIGSGAVESGIKQMSRRIKISGAQWNEKNVPQSCLAHRSAYLGMAFIVGAKVTCSQLQSVWGSDRTSSKNDLVRQGDGTQPGLVPADKAPAPVQKLSVPLARKVSLESSSRWLLRKEAK